MMALKRHIEREGLSQAEAAKVFGVTQPHISNLMRGKINLFGLATSVAVQQKMMRHADIRTTMNIYGDVVTDGMATAGIKVAQLAFQGIGAQTERGGV